MRSSSQAQRLRSAFLSTDVLPETPTQTVATRKRSSSAAHVASLRCECWRRRRHRPSCFVALADGRPARIETVHSRASQKQWAGGISETGSRRRRKRHHGALSSRNDPLRTTSKITFFDSKTKNKTKSSCRLLYTAAYGSLIVENSEKSGILPVSFYFCNITRSKSSRGKKKWCTAIYENNGGLAIKRRT